MRLASLALYTAVLAAPLGCNSPVPAAPDAAWTVNMSSNGGACMINFSTRSLGSVNNQNRNATVTDMMAADGGIASVRCSVVGSGSTFSVTGKTEQSIDLLDVNIPSLSTSATVDMPSTGAISYLSDATVVPYSGNCKFYFNGPSEGVAVGKVWASFTCDAISNNMAMNSSVCPVLESYVLFENCLTM
jgi:hypothetical protein